jgi:multiple sugar transport system substrate-binding protein
LVETYALAWANREGAKVEVLPYEAAVGPSPQADLWVIETAQLPHWAATGGLLPVPDSLTGRDGSYEWANLLPIFRDKLLLWDGTAYALPLLGESPLCFYRADLLGDAENQTAFQERFHRKLTAPETWDEFVDVAEFFQGRPEAGIKGPSLPPLPQRDTDLERELYAIAAPLARRGSHDDDRQAVPPVEMFSFHFDLATGEPRIDTAGFVQALKLLQALQKHRPAQSAAEPVKAFAQGQAVLCLAEVGAIQHFQAKNSLVREKFDVCAVPGSRVVYSYAQGERQELPLVNRVPYLGAGGWLGVVPKTAAHPEAAFALLAELGGPQRSRQIVIEPKFGGGAFRNEHFSNAAGWSGFGLNQARTLALVETVRQALVHPGLKNPVMRLRTPDEAAYQRVLVAELRKALAEGEDAQQALSAVARGWRDLIEKQGATSHRADYYRSLNLQPPP